ncbi:DUF4240 domain-containing protein [Lacibacter sp. H407]|uniref:DUF4240 domain-containing protein n=1 Tax=Lacibacter sp. H407 TaxID=3133423 RepID=UPI0030C35DD6
MNITFVAISIFLLLLLIRLIFRKVIDLPNYTGQLLTNKFPVSNLMPEEEFWKIIETTRNGANKNYPAHCSLLTNTLSKLSNDEIIGFNRTFTLLMAKSYSYKLWEAVYSLNGGSSDDAFEYFRSWLIGQGRNKFYWALKFPRILFLIGVKELVENYEGIANCAYLAYQQKNDSDIALVTDIPYSDGGIMFKETEAFFKYPELALLAW